LQAAESHLRLHIRPYFGPRPLGAISAQVVQRWQNELKRRASHNLTMACRSILNRILEAAEGERLIPVNPVRKVHAPERPVDPEVVFGRVRRRAYTPEEKRAAPRRRNRSGTGSRPNVQLNRDSVSRPNEWKRNKRVWLVGSTVGHPARR
jgi:hypothetical protein